MKEIELNTNTSCNSLYNQIGFRELKEFVVAANSNNAILVPIEEDDFWAQMRSIIREELKLIVAAENSSGKGQKKIKETNGFQYKPLYDMKELRELFGNVSRTTIYDWIKCGKLKPKKMKGKVYFLWMDIEKLLKEI